MIILPLSTRLNIELLRQAGLTSPGQRFCQSFSCIDGCRSSNFQNHHQRGNHRTLLNSSGDRDLPKISTLNYHLVPNMPRGQLIRARTYRGGRGKRERRRERKKKMVYTLISRSWGATDRLTNIRTDISSYENASCHLDTVLKRRMFKLNSRKSNLQAQVRTKLRMTESDKLKIKKKRFHSTITL